MFWVKRHKCERDKFSCTFRRCKIYTCFSGGKISTSLCLSGIYTGLVHIAKIHKSKISEFWHKFSSIKINRHMFARIPTQDKKWTLADSNPCLGRHDASRSRDYRRTRQALVVPNVVFNLLHPASCHHHLYSTQQNSTFSLSFVTMPEPDEYEQAAFQLQRGLDKLIQEGLSDFCVQDIIYDATDSQQKRFPPDSRLFRGLADSLRPEHEVLRGSKSVQSSLWPTMLSSPADLRSLKLAGVQPTNRTLILDFGTAIFQVRGSRIVELMISANWRLHF